MEVVFLHFEVWVADSKVFDVRFGFSMSKSPRGQVLSRFRWIGDGFIRVEMFKTCFCFYPFMVLITVHRGANNEYTGGPGGPGTGFCTPGGGFVVIELVASHHCN